MPQIKVEHIVSFSSEDPNYPVNNLLSKDIVNKRWVGQEKGESSASVILQLEKSTSITSIHIGSYHSALIEVLVGRSEASGQAYEVLLCASTFMNPADSRNSLNISRVRTFTTEQLVPSVQSKNWDRVRVVCTQPFNRHVQYGLSFIHLFSSNTQPSAAEVQMTLPSIQTNLGRFKLRDPSSDEESSGGSFQPGELFAKMKQSPSLSTDAQIRKAGAATIFKDNEESNLLVKTVKTSNPSNPSPGAKLKTLEKKEILSRGRDELMYDDEDDNVNSKIDRIIKRDREQKNEINKKIALEKLKQAKNEPKKGVSKFDFRNKSPKKNNTSDSDDKEKDIKKPVVKLNTTLTKDDSKTKDKGNAVNINNKRKLPIDNGASPSLKTPRIDTKNNGADSPTPFDNIVFGPQCLRGVVFVLSGYVNPKRGSLRDTAMSLGARYSPDWGSNCTHLICAFTNTPKHDQVKKAGGNPTIVSGQWIEECGEENAHLPWQWYALDRKKKVDRPPGPIKKPNVDKLAAQKPTTSSSKDESDNEDASIQTNTRVNNDMLSESEGDTDDEIEKVMKINEALEKAKCESTIEESKPTPKKHVDQLSDESSTDIEEDAIAVKINEPTDRSLLSVYDQDTDAESP